MDPHRLSLAVEHATGHVTRWAADEPDASDVPLGLRFTTSIPGGHKDCTFDLPRRIDLDYPDLNLFDTVKVLGAGNEPVWEGRVTQLPRSHGDGHSIQVGCVGHSAHLRDNPFFREAYVDRDLSHWRGVSAGRRAILLTAKSSVHDPTVAWDPATGSAALALSFDRIYQPGDGRNTLSEAWYDAQGLALGEVRCVVDYRADAGGANWHLEVGLSDDDETVVAGTTAELTDVSADSTVSEATTATTRKFGFLRLYNSNSPVDTTGTYEVLNTGLAVYGKHGLTQHGDAAPFGFYASDIIADIVSRVAPLLDYTTGTDGTIEPTSFTIPHSVFREPVTAEDAILQVNKHHFMEWGCWGRTFFFRSPDPDRLTWEARLDEGAELSLEGDTGDEVYNGVVASYREPDGTPRTVGPPGSGADAEDTQLEDTSESNPVNRQGIPIRWARLDLSQPTTSAAAIQIASVYLQEKSLPQRRGSLTVTGTCRHPTKGLRPVSEIRAGDFIRVPDHPADVSRRIIETSYDHERRSASLSLSNTVFKLDALFERMGVAAIGVL